MSFQEMDIKLIYDTSQVKITEELIVPLLCKAKRYYRGVGYFSSAWLRLVSKGLKEFVSNQGKITLLTSPQLSNEDWNAIIQGEKAKSDQVLYRAISEQLSGFDQETKIETLNLFSWLIADGIIDLKFVLCANQVGNYHDKIAIFEDEENNRICLHGSLNDSLQATLNGECVSVFKSWIPGQDAYLAEHYDSFMKMSNQENEYYQIFDIPQMLLEEFKKYQLPDCPYRQTVKKKNQISLPDYITELKLYQEEAIQALINNQWNGMFEMATGTGKTITSIECSRRYLEQKKRIFLIIVVPFRHLVSQWENVLQDFSYDHILCCYDNINTWLPKAKRNVKNFNAEMVDVTCMITTYHTGATEHFISVISKIKEHAFLIADECHYMGSTGYASLMNVENYSVRLGLSATPKRWFDEEGTAALRRFFEKTVYEYTLSDAIRNGYLTRYEYHPVVVHLSEDELEAYMELSKKISKAYAGGNPEETNQNSYLQTLLRKRATLTAKAVNKKQVLRKMIKEAKENGNLSHTLVYCAKGESKEIVRLLADLDIKVHDFVYDVPDKQRGKILKEFADGDIEVLVAIKCLDEGVDIPSTRTAYFLASTSNPREFVQRRGRILRKCKNKELAYLYDFILLPEPGHGYEEEEERKVYLSMLKRELPRYSEFVQNADNKYMARSVLHPYLSEVKADYLLDMRPYELYHEFYDEVQRKEQEEE